VVNPEAIIMNLRSYENLISHKLRGYFLFSQELATGPYFKPDESIPNSYVIFL
jgi:hypothetical protein